MNQHNSDTKKKNASPGTTTDTHKNGDGGGKVNNQLNRKNFLRDGSIVFTNIFLSNIAPEEEFNTVRATLSKHAKQFPRMLDKGCIDLNRGLNTNMILKNIDRKEEGVECVSKVCREFISLNTKIMDIYASTTSSEKMKDVFEQTFRELVKTYGEEFYLYGLPFILFKEIFETFLMECRKKTIVDVKNKIRGMDEIIVKQMGVDENGEINIEKVQENIVFFPFEEGVNRLIYAFSRVMNICYPIIQEDLGVEKAEKLCSGLFEKILRNHRSFLSKYKISDAVPNGVNVPMIKSLFEPGKIYLKEEEEPMHAFKIFLTSIEQGYSGICITKNYPDNIRNKYSLKKETPIIWFTSLKTEGETCISCEETQRLVKITKDFVTNNDAGVILLDCMSRLITTVGYDDTLSLLNRMITIVKPSNFRIIVSVNPQTLDESERYSLSKITTKLSKTMKP